MSESDMRGTSPDFADAHPSFALHPLALHERLCLRPILSKWAGPQTLSPDAHT
jgi:hypothetical protein